MSKESPLTIFGHELANRAGEIQTILPNNVNHERFQQLAFTAVNRNPDLLICSRQSLHIAITNAAEDGLMPDGKEGVINKYRNKKTGIHEAKWIPMIHGIRKRANELGGVIIGAEVVREKDHFIWRQGDNPSIEHIPVQLGGDRGKLIGAYAIFRDGDKILHREVMDVQQINDVRGHSSQPTGLLWGKFESEAYRKTVVRRGVKTVPSVSPELSRIIEREDSTFSFETKKNDNSSPSKPPSPTKPPKPPSPPKPSTTSTNIKNDVVDGEIEESEFEKRLDDFHEKLAGATSLADMNELWDRFDDSSLSQSELDQGSDAFNFHLRLLEDG